MVDQTGGERRKEVVAFSVRLSDICHIAVHKVLKDWITVSGDGNSWIVAILNDEEDEE